MGFNKYYIPEPTDLIKTIISSGPNEFMRLRSKVDAVIGNSVSISIMDHVYDRVLDGKSDDSILKSLKLKFPDQYEKALLA